MTGRKHILRYHDLPSITGLSEMSIRRLVAAGDFPPPLRLSPNAVGFDSQAVDNWISERVPATAQPGRQA